MEERKFLYILILLTGCTYIVYCQTASLARASFGESCDKGTRCDSRASLSCMEWKGDNGMETRCQCVKPKEMTYDRSKGKCVVLSGERCSYTAVEILMDQTQEKRWTERLDCIENALCNTDGFCGCLNEYFEDSEGACSPRRLYSQNCTKDDECRTDKHLVCNEGLCSCNLTEAVFDPAYNQCVARAGSSCIKYERCVRNAHCPNRRHGYYRALGSNSYDQCSCTSEYTRSKTGLCLAKYGMACDTQSAPCSAEFSCTNGKCTCHFPDHQFYDSSATQCVSYVRGPCSEEVDGSILQFQCLSNAECKNHNGIMECLCKDGFIESTKRRCSVAYGQTCGDGALCDEVANLICKQGQCDCHDFETYDKGQDKCLGLVGAKCKLNSSVSNSCTEGASCHSFRDSSLGEGVCRCMLPSVPDSGRKCTSLLLIEDDGKIDVINGTVESNEEILAI